MKKYPISNSSTETIEFKAHENQYALVHQVKSSSGNTYTTTILNKRELLNLYGAICEEILNRSKL